MQTDLSRRNILITGASSGIGRAVSVAVYESGASVFLLGRNIERLDETAKLCTSTHSAEHKDNSGEVRKIVPISYDLTADPDDIPKLLQRLSSEYGEFSGIVHSAGIEMARPLRSIKTLNLVNTYIINAVTGAMLIKGLSLVGVHSKSGSSAVLISSISASCGNAGLLCYSMSKGAVESCVKTLAIELISSKIRVNCIAPAMIKTPMLEKGTYQDIQSLGDSRKDLVELRHPMGFGEPKDVANAALFLLSDASKYVNGITLFTDGGYAAQ
ncbi:MAG: SDR family oxidoreductase [Planctomycetaceae bacterium]|jgi:NAD(P)-dependent dehydrogenase (short-subunit alcohol dehydrogenase family)|nr:SDR family oxidoreductase [Planctomycetaceae bacterium]